jgi:RNA polymerase sigma-70 factor (ECF subfamily)
VTKTPDSEFAEFYQEYWPRLVAALHTVVPEGDDAEDVAQEAFARAYRDWSRVRSHDNPEGWLFITGYRLAVSLRRRARVRRRHVGSSRTSETSETEEPMSFALEQLMSSLPHEQRVVLLLRLHYGFSSSETARILRRPEGTVKSQLSRACARLRRIMTTEE